MADASEDVVLSLNLSGLDGDLLTKVKKIVKDELKPVKAENKKLKKQVETQKKEIDALKKAKPAKAKKEIANMTEIKKQYEKFKADVGKLETRVKAVEGGTKRIAPATTIASKTVAVEGKVKEISPEMKALEMKIKSLQSLLEEMREAGMRVSTGRKQRKGMSDAEKLELVREHVKDYDKKEKQYVGMSQELAGLLDKHPEPASELKLEYMESQLPRAMQIEGIIRKEHGQAARERKKKYMAKPPKYTEDQMKQRRDLVEKYFPEYVKEMEKQRANLIRTKKFNEEQITAQLGSFFDTMHKRAKQIDDMRTGRQRSGAKISEKDKELMLAAKDYFTPRQLSSLIDIEDRKRLAELQSITDQEGLAKTRTEYKILVKRIADRQKMAKEQIKGEMGKQALSEKEEKLFFTNAERYTKNLTAEIKAAERREEREKERTDRIEKKKQRDAQSHAYHLERMEFREENRLQRMAQQHALSLEKTEANFSHIRNQKIKSAGRLTRRLAMTTGGLMAGKPSLSIAGILGAAASQIDPSTARGTAVISALLAAPAVLEMTKKIIKLLSTKGYPLNRDWRREIETEINGLMDIEEKKKRMLGIDQYIVTQVDDYQSASGAQVYNSFLNRDEANITKRGLAEKAFGIDY